MNKSEFVKAVSEKAELSQKDAEKAVNAFMEVVTESLSDEEDVVLVGFGTFSVAERAARTAMDFRTKEKVTIPASKTVKFKVGKKLKDAVK